MDIVLIIDVHVSEHRNSKKVKKKRHKANYIKTFEAVQRAENNGACKEPAICLSMLLTFN